MPDRSVKVTLGANINPLKSAMNDAARSVDQVSASATKMGGSVKGGLASLKDTMNATLKGIGSVEIVVGGLYASALKTGIGFNALQQSSRAALTAIMGSAEAANRQMDELFKFTATSPLPKEAYIQAQQTLLSFGVSAQKVIPILKAIDDTTIAIGGNAETVGQLTLVMGQIQSQGKITGRELMRLGMAGVDAAQMIGTQMGLTAQQVRDKISKSAIDADTALSALAAGMEAKFGGASEMVKKQFQGATDRMKAAWRDLGGELAKPLVDPVSGGKLVVWLNDTADIIRAMTPHVVELQNAFASAFGASGIHNGLQGIVTWLKQLDPVQVQAFAKRMGELAPIISAVGAASLTMATSNLPVIGGFMKALGPLPAALAAAALASPQLRGALMDLLSAAAPLVEAAGKLAGSLLEMGQSVITAGADLLTSLVPAVSSLAGVLTPLVELVAGVVHTFSEMPGPVKDVAVALGLMIALKGPLASFGIATLDAFNVLKSAVANTVLEFRTTPSVFGSFATAGKNAATTVMNAFGGPWMIGLTAAAAAVALLVKQWKDGQPVVRDFTTAVDANTGALAANAAESAAKTMTDDLMTWQKLGGDVATYTQAVLGNSDAQKTLRAQITTMGATLLENSAFWKNYGAIITGAGYTSHEVSVALQQDAEGNGAAWKEMGRNIQRQAGGSIDAIGSLRAAYGPLSKATEQYGANVGTLNADLARAEVQHKATGDAIRNGAQAAQDSYVAWLQARSAIGAAGDGAAFTASQVDGLSDAVKAFGDETDTANTRLKFFTLSVDELAGRNVSLEAATKLLNDQTRNLTEGLKDASNATKGHVGSLIEANGTINTVTAAGSKLYDTVSNYRQAYDAATNAARDHALATGTNADAIVAARKAADEARATFLAQAAALGVSRTDAVKMADAMGILEGKKLTAKTLGVYVDDQATAALQKLNNMQLNAKTLRVTAEVSGLTGEKVFISGSGARGMAKGGWIPGAADGEWISGGTPGKDSVLRWLMPGEAVIPTAAAQANKPLVNALMTGRNVAGASGPIDVVVTIRGDGPLSEAMAATADIRIDQHQQGQDRLDVTLSRARRVG